MEDSRDNDQHRVAIAADTQVSIVTGLPSIMQADPELTAEFFENILEGLSVEHDSDLKTNRLYIQLEGELR